MCSITKGVEVMWSIAKSIRCTIKVWVLLQNLFTFNNSILVTVLPMFVSTQYVYSQRRGVHSLSVTITVTQNRQTYWVTQPSTLLSEYAYTTIICLTPWYECLPNRAGNVQRLLNCSKLRSDSCNSQSSRSLNFNTFLGHGIDGHPKDIL